MLDSEQVNSIKSQILKQIEHFPESQRESAKKQVLEMSDEELEEFLEKNNLVKPEKTQERGCIFCSIIEGKTPAYKLSENKSAIAILDINPLSKGHSIIVPKKHDSIEKLPSSVLNLAKKIAKRIKLKLKPEEVKIETSAIEGHGIISIVPFYKNIKLEKKPANPAELKSLQNILTIKTRKKRESKQAKQIKPQQEIKPNLSKLPFAPIRVP